MRKLFSAGVVCLLALALAVPAQAQGGAKQCTADIQLNVGRTEWLTLYANLILVVDQAATNESITYYDVHGNGMYELPDGTSGRFVIESGRWSSASSDANRTITVRMVSGVLRDVTVVVNALLVGNGNLSGVWYDISDPNSSGSAAGPTSC